MAERKLSGMQKLGLAMAAFGQGMTGQPFASNIMGNWQKQDELAAEQAYRQWQMKQQAAELDAGLAKNGIVAPTPQQLNENIVAQSIGKGKPMYEIGDKKYMYNPQAMGQFNREMRNSANTLRKEFNTSQITKNYDIINRGLKTIEQAYKISTSADSKSRIASDQALGVMFQKMLDPESVVRESEYARTPEGQAFMSKIPGWIDQIQKGGLKLTNEDRQALLDMSRKMFESSASIYNSHIDRYENLAGLYGVPTDMIMGGISRIELPTVGNEDLGRIKITPAEAKAELERRRKK